MSKIVNLGTIPSTHVFAKEHLGDLPSGETIALIADHQTAGIGRRGHFWHSPEGQNLYLTLVTPLPDSSPPMESLAQFFSLMAARAIGGMGGTPQIKWPNDIFLGGKKAGGVICEVVERDGGRVVLAGIGINNNTPKEVLDEIDQPATSLEQMGVVVSRDDLLQKILEEFEAHWSTWCREGLAPFQEEYDKLRLEKEKTG